MNTAALTGLLLGMSIGGIHTLLQLRALERNRKRHAAAGPGAGLMQAVPGSMTRVAMLLLALVLVQVFVPTADLWWLSGGLFVALGIPMVYRLKQLRQS